MSSRRMRKKRTRQILMIAAVVFILVIVVALVVLLLRSIKTLKSITLTPNFAETELDVGQDYVFSIKGNPAKAKLKSIEYMVDDATATFQKGSEDGTAVLHTGAEGVVTVYIKKDKIESNKITFQVVDQMRKAEEEAAAAQKAAEEAAAAAAEAQAEEEELTQGTSYVMVTGDSVRMRAEPNTDCEIVRTCKKGETYTRIETVDDWTKVDYNGRECYIKSEFLKDVTEEEAQQAQADTADNSADTKKEEKKEEKKKEEAKPADNTNANANADAQKAADEAAQKAAEEAAKKAAEDAAALAAAQQAVAAATAGTYNLNGVTVNATEYKFLLDMFRFATPNGTDEEAKAEVLIHSGGEIEAILKDRGYR